MEPRAGFEPATPALPRRSPTGLGYRGACIPISCGTVFYALRIPKAVQLNKYKRGRRLNILSLCSCGGVRVWSKEAGLGPAAVGLHGFKPHPPHHYVENCGGFIRAMRSSVFVFSEDLMLVKVADVFEPCVYQCAHVFFVFGYF